MAHGFPSGQERPVCRLCAEEKYKAGAFIFPQRGPHSGPEPEGLKGGKPARWTETVIHFPREKSSRSFMGNSEELA
ncbi:MAG: hypothetical protein LBG98_01180 [Puniceicoccales bacterium]|jgi:hypothetical protein|nr:hypothetical protein [Puniceicoccales bacterium]